MSDSRVDKLTAHYVQMMGADDRWQYSHEAEVRREAEWHVKDLEAAGLVIIDPEATVTRALLRDRLEDAFGSFLAHDPAKPDVFWPTAVTAVLDALRGQR